MGKYEIPIWLRLQSRVRDVLFCYLSLYALLVMTVHAADTQEQPERLLDRSPFDRITLDAANQGAVIDVYPLELPGRRVPQPLPTEGALKLRRVVDPSLEYSVSWDSIARIELYEQLLLSEVRQLMDAEAMGAAYDDLAMLHKHYPNLSGLREATDQYLQRDALLEYRAGRYDEALAILQALHDRNPNYPGLIKAVEAVADRLIRKLITEKKYYASRKVLELLEQAFTALDLQSVSTWKQRFRQASQRQLKIARDALNQKQYGVARAALRQATEILPHLPGLRPLVAQLAREHSEIVVGVARHGPNHPRWHERPPWPRGGQPHEGFIRNTSAPLSDWAAVRVAPLVDPPLIERIGYGAEGGVYRCPWASMEIDESGLKLFLQLTPDALRLGATADGLARGLLALADSTSPYYQEDYANRFQDIALVQGQSVEIRWKRIPVRPEALLRCRARSVHSLENDLIYYQSEDGQEPGVVRFERRGSRELLRDDPKNPPAGRQEMHAEGPQSIVERQFREDEAAVKALLRGEVDLLDRVPPWQLEKLEAYDQLVVGSYRLPTIHVLLFNPRNRLLGQREFRRALCYGIDRAGLVRDILLADKLISGFRSVSGPFPAGKSRHDPVGYAYNQKLAARPYEPRLAAVLAEVARAAEAKVAQENRVSEETWAKESLANEASEAAERDQKQADDQGEGPSLNGEQDLQQESHPEETQPLVLLYPPEPVARTVCQTIQIQLEKIGIPTELRELTAGVSVARSAGGVADKDSSVTEDYDLIYTELAMWEPVVDARRLLGPGGEAGRCSASMGLALDRLDRAQNWKQVQANLRQVHQIAFYDLPVIPLWQTYNYFAYRKTLHGFGEAPIWFYQQVAQWRKIENEPEP